MTKKSSLVHTNQYYNAGQLEAKWGIEVPHATLGSN
ncbi:hypothetical protein OOU_Y34scaffold00765g64 [Pyricularia oryzae Y34]|uniref:Uncharacterized protein n=2 Tax=Pyricularia oryzae TaxID=318829 RepID=A0AA97NQU2_PYRO3|nr:hypothetical protein OOU_Y34scaffold00765g64 [Pyricularia oryzae Y34]